MTARNLAGRRRGRAGVVVRIMLGLALTVMLLMPGAGHAGEISTHVDVGLLWLPDRAASSAPMPIVIVLHDLPGVDRRIWRYGRQITAAGIAVIHAELLDFSADGVVPAVASDDTVVARARLMTVIDFVREDPRFAQAPIGILAFGAAGEVAMRAAADRTTSGRIAAMALLYPGCATVAVPTHGMAPRSPILLLHGNADPANPSADCAGLANRIAHFAPIRRLQYAGAGYAWDLPPLGAHEAFRLPWPGRPGMRVPVSFWHEAAEFSAAQVTSFFARALAAQP